MPSGHDERASPKGLTAQGQLSARPSPRLHASASMPNIWRGESPSPLSVRRTPSRLRLIPDDANNSQMISPLGLHIPASTRLSEGRDPGQPLTPPMSPNAPTSYQTNQQQSFGASRISPFRGSPPSFNPFSSYNCMLPSPARSTHHTQQPIAEETQNPALNSASLVQFPLTEQQPALVPDSEHDDSASESPTLVTPSTLVSPSRRTHLDSPVSILDYGAGIPRSGRLLLVSHVPRDATDEEVLYNFSVLGDLKGLYVRYLASNGVVILAFFDMRDAARAHRYHLRARRFFGDSVALESHFISPTQLSKQLGASSFVDECEGEVYISTMGEGTLNQTALQNALASYGGLRQFRVVGLHGKAFFAEFFDTRDADNAVQDLHDRQLLGVHLRLTHRQPPAILNLATYDSFTSISDLQRQHDEIALFQHYRQIVERKQREELEAAILAMRTPDSGDIARGGPFDVTGGTLGRRGSFPGSSPRIDEREERFASLTDGSILLGSPNDRQSEFERERKSSNTYGPDHSKTVVPSFSSPRTPTRTDSQQTSGIVTPKRKISLPPYSGPLPVPDSRSDMTWPLPVLQRLPTPPSSGGATISMSGGSSSSGADSPEFFIPTQTPPRRQGRAVHGSSGAQAAHAFLPSAARAVLDVIREPPPERNRIDLNRIREGLDTRTTVMLKNVPNKMTDKHLMAFIDSVTPKSYSFLYLRMDFENHCNVGYAFVNFIDVSSLLRFAETKLGQKWGMFNSEKVLHMSYANYQGKEALVEKFRNSGVMEEREAWRPKIFYSSGPRKGEPEPFPPPNNHLRQQRSFQNGRAQGLYSSNAPHAVSYGLSAF